jgi:Uri superfamily endonuclease
MSQLDTLKSKCGVYTLVLFVSQPVALTVGKLGKQTFPKGYYTYTGSAHGKGATSLNNRIKRHLRKTKHNFWHIDYLQENQHVSVMAVVSVLTKEKLECTINSKLKNVLDTTVVVNGFGSSDCKKGCRSHLLYYPQVADIEFLVQKLVTLYASCGGVCLVNVARQPFV